MKKMMMCKKIPGVALLAAAFLFSAGELSAQLPKEPSPLVRGSDGKFTYKQDERGNCIPDYSFAGYELSEKGIPVVPVKAFIPAMSGDATETIQQALDYLATQPVDANGFRGAVLLDKGTFEIAGALKIKTSGIVLRGSGFGNGGTTLLGTGVLRQTLIEVEGRDNRTYGKSTDVADAYVPVNATTLTVADASGLKAGDRVIVQRKTNQAWIDELKCNTFGGTLQTMSWKPGDKDLFFDRKITAVDGNKITIDIPLTNAIEREWGGGVVTPYTWTGRISQVGIEFLNLESTWDGKNVKDELHRWMAVSLQNVENAWVRQLTFKHFASSAVFVQDNASKITVEDCISTDPVSEIGGQRRYTYHTLGQQVLFLHCYAENGYHDFAVGQSATGLTAFVQCMAVTPYSFSGPVESWATGILFDIVNIDGENITFKNRGQDDNGSGWGGANSLLWNTTAARIDNYRPPTAQNWSFGCWSQFAGDGYWEDVNSHISPFSFFYAQLEQRLGHPVDAQARLQPKDRNEVTSPTYEKAQELTILARNPLVTVKDWILLATPPAGALDYAKESAWTLKKAATPEKPYAIAEPLAVKNGKLVRGERLLTGASQGIRYWNGSLNRSWTETVAPHLTRYVPGRTGQGFTDDLEAVAQGMIDQNRVVLNHNYGLWYERRRDDHERIRRADGNVWAPFYELPFARSGEGRAWDGLSKYDLTKYNPWYFDRLAQFAAVADRTGLVLENQHYHQHNIIEAGAHWADFPWRSANNINDTGFPEPVPYAGDKRIFMAEHFYDLNNPTRVALHKAYIRKNLENFPENSGVIHSISAEFTGPEHFARFWLGEVKAWQQETGRDAMISLATTKDVQDAILADPELRAVVDIIEIRFWHYRADGSLYAPPGGVNMAPRQHARQVDPGESSFEQVYRAVREYRERYPEKAVTYYSYTYDIDVEVPSFGWAAFMAGGSMTAIPRIATPAFQKETAGMDVLPTGEGQYVLGKSGTGYVIYSTTGTADITLGGDRAGYRAYWIDAESGSLTPLPRTVRDGDKLKVDGPRVLWLTKSR